MKSKISYQDRVEKALGDGKPWRAKEILQGRISSLPYDKECYELYGKVLLQMGDTVNAGRMLFGSGREFPEYQEAIKLFLQRNNLLTWKDLLFLLPRGIRQVSFENMPENVQGELMKRGFSATEYQQLLENLRTFPEVEKEPSRWDKLKNNFFIISVYLILGWVFMAIIGGTILMLRNIAHFMMRNFG